jgi:hypothetical protein
MESNQELIQEVVGELEVSKELDTFSRLNEEEMEEYYCMDCRFGNTEDGEEAVCEACAYL